MDKIFIIGNILFIQIDNWCSDYNLTAKYLKSSIGGGISSNLEIWTKDEILKQWPTAKSCKDFLHIKEVWNK